MASPNRILYVIATLDPHGAERQMVTLARRLDRERFEPMVCALTRGGPLEQDLDQAGIETVILGKSRKLDLSVVWRLKRLIREREIDLVHTWLFTGNAYGRAAAWLAGGCKIVASERSVDRWRNVIHRSVDRFLARRTGCILANAQAVRQFLIYRERIAAEKIEVVPNGIDITRFEGVKPAPIRAELGLSEDAPLIGCVARLAEQKGLEYLVLAAREVVERIPQAAFVIAGSGPEEEEIRDLIVELDMEGKVHLLGHRDDAPAVMAALDVFVLPSLWEGLPNVMLEAMAAGLPTVATAVDGALELILENKNGILVPPGDARSLANVIAQLVENPDLGYRLAANGQQRVQGYTIERMVERTQAVYERLLSSE